LQHNALKKYFKVKKIVTIKNIDKKGVNMVSLT
jgi:hypothetical protein